MDQIFLLLHPLSEKRSIKCYQRQRSGEGRQIENPASKNWVKRQFSLEKKMVIGTLATQRQTGRVAHRRRRARQEALVRNVYHQETWICQKGFFFFWNALALIKHSFWKIFSGPGWYFEVKSEERREEKEHSPPVTWCLGYLVEHGRPLWNLGWMTGVWAFPKAPVSDLFRLEKKTH